LLPPTLDSVYFVNSGTEAIEGRAEAGQTRHRAHQAGGLPKELSRQHPRSLSLTDNEDEEVPQQTPAARRGAHHFNEPGDLELIDHRTAACVVVEPIQGDAGVRIPDADWMQALRNAVHRGGRACRVR
jgi:acetylornithine/N-succinyldiaminopimelate aminotransferase